jgi:hypothetical protein
MDDLKGHKCDPEAVKELEEAAERVGGGWNYRVCTFTSPEGHRKIGVFEVYYDKKRKPTMRATEPELSWFIENCGEEDTEESCKKAAQWELKCMLKAFRAPTLNAAKDFKNEDPS